MDLVDLRSRWNDILNLLEREDRAAWIVFFDARLAKLEGNCLTLDFSDSEKFANSFDYSAKRAHFRGALERAIQKICGATLEIMQ